MKTYKAATLRKMVNDGRIVFMTDLYFNHAEIRWTRTNKRETIEVVNPFAKCEKCGTRINSIWALCLDCADDMHTAMGSGIR